MNKNNNYQCKMCWNKALTFGVGSIKLSFRTIVFTCKDVFNPNVTTFQSNCAKGLHFSAFHYCIVDLTFISAHTLLTIKCMLYIFYVFSQNYLVSSYENRGLQTLN